jgi:hypothetical protein
MSDTAKKILKQEYDKLKKAFEKITKSHKKEAQPQLVLQPYRTKKYFLGVPDPFTFFIYKEYQQRMRPFF